MYHRSRTSSWMAGLLFFCAVMGGARQAEVDQKAIDASWKRLNKVRIHPGMWLSRTDVNEWGFHLKEIRLAMEELGFDQVVTIAINLDGGMRIGLGTYKPNMIPAVSTDMQNGTSGPPARTVSWASIPNLVEVATNIRADPVELYRVVFMDATGKVRASFLTRVLMN